MEEKFNLEFTFQEVNLLLSGLGELPYKISAPLRTNIVNQYEEIQRSKAKDENPEKPVKKK